MLRAVACASLLSVVGCQQAASSRPRPDPPPLPARSATPAPAGSSATLLGGGESLLGGPTRVDLIPRAMGAPVGR